MEASINKACFLHVVTVLLIHNKNLSVPCGSRVCGLWLGDPSSAVLSLKSEK